MKRSLYIFLLFASILFYGGTAVYIENRSEAEDAFEYAHMAEVSHHQWMFHKHHLLYGPTIELGYGFLQMMGYEGRAYAPIVAVSCLSAAGSLLFFFLFCYRRFSLRPISSLLATGFLGFSYGFWRYAAEVEISLPASFLMLSALYFATDTKRMNIHFVLSLVLSVLAVLMHIMNAIAVFCAIPCFYLLSKRWKAMCIHFGICGALVWVAYWIAASSGLMPESDGTRFSHVGLGSIVKAVIALGQCIVSGNFMMGFASVRAFLSELFAARMLMEEFYLGARLSRGVVLFSSTSLFVFLGSFVACLLRAGWVWKNKLDLRSRLRLPDGRASLAVALVWFIGYAGLLVCIEPGNPELWVMGLVPFWLLVCGLVLLPLAADNRLWLPFFVLIVLIVHNGIAGIGMLGDTQKDYQAQKAGWILAHATSDDMVITAGDPVFERYLRYRFSGDVVYLHDCPVDLLQHGTIPHSEGRIYVLDDVFEQIKSLRVRFPERTDLIDSYAAEIRPKVEKVHNDEFGGIYMILPGFQATSASNDVSNADSQ